MEEKKYTKIAVRAGAGLAEVLVELISLSVKHEGELYCVEFNGQALRSDTDSLDSAYLKVTGNTYSECLRKENEFRENCKRAESEHKAAVPNLTEEWKARGHEVLTPIHWEYWDKIVPARLNDLYHGMELGHCLDIVKILNNGGTLDEAKAEIMKQNHYVVEFGRGYGQGICRAWLRIRGIRQGALK